MTQRRVACAALLLLFLLALPLHAADRRKIATLNIAATSLFTSVSCLVQKKARPIACLTIGALGGAGFYGAKKLAGDGHVTAGWLAANLAGSVVENTTAGEHPLSRIGYTFGPFRLRLATPFDRKRESYVDVDVSAAELVYLGRAIEDADDVDIRDGMIWYETESPDIDDEGRSVHGYTWGIFPGVWSGARKSVWHHESVHAVQSLQLDSLEPPVLTLDRERRPIRVRYLRAGALNLTENLTSQLLPYEDRWVEIEAYRLAEDQRPPR